MQMLHRPNARIITHRLLQIIREVPDLTRISPHRMLRSPTLIRKHRKKPIRQLAKLRTSLTHR